MKQYRLSGTREQIGNFFEVCQAASNCMPVYESIVLSSWPLGGDMNLGMCISLNEKVKHAEGAVRKIAMACGIKLEPLTEKESALARQVCEAESKVHVLRCAVDATTMLKAFKRLIDYECNTLDCWLEESKQDKALWHLYQGQFNHLVLLRERMISPEWVLQFLDAEKFDMPEAKERVF